MTNWKEHKELQRALQAYLHEKNLILNGEEVYQSGIDCVGIFIDNHIVLSIGLPPVSNYPVQETQYTDKYLRTINAIAG